MAPKAAAKRAAARKGTGVPRSAAYLPEPGDAEGEADGEQALVQPLAFIPADPVDERLTLEGLVLSADGKVNLVAYQDLFPTFAGEPPPPQHPQPEHPGVRQGEQVPKGMRIWDDARAGATEKDGAGWICRRAATSTEKSKEKWFNIRMCGSWRMAFLLARLQKQYWDRHAVWLQGGDDAEPPRAGQGTAASAAAAAAAEGDAGLAAGARDAAAQRGGARPPATPTKRPRQQGDEPGTGKRPRRGAGRAGTTVSKVQAPQKPSLVTANDFAGSARVREILIARQRQQDLRQQQPQPQPQQRQPPQYEYVPGEPL